MKSYKFFAVGILAVASLCAGSARAQMDTSDPIVVRTPSTVSPTVKGNWLKAEVIHADSTTMVVREQGNSRMIHTFTFAPEIKDRMQAIYNAGGYQYGDKVRILYNPGETVARRIQGRPSKAS
jgi:hypothetical protein